MSQWVIGGKEMQRKIFFEFLKLSCNEDFEV